DDLEVEEIAILLPELERGFDADQALNHIYVGLRPYRGRAGLHRHVEHLARARKHVFPLLLAFEDSGNADRLFESAAARRHSPMKQLLLEMEMGLQQPRNCGAAASIHDPLRAGADAALDRRNAPAVDGDV